MTPMSKQSYELCLHTRTKSWKMPFAKEWLVTKSIVSERFCRWKRQGSLQIILSCVQNECSKMRKILSCRNVPGAKNWGPMNLPQKLRCHSCFEAQLAVSFSCSNLQSIWNSIGLACLSKIQTKENEKNLKKNTKCSKLLLITSYQ